jgi:hypothetical protein
MLVVGGGYANGVLALMLSAVCCVVVVLMSSAFNFVAVNIAFNVGNINSTVAESRVTMQQKY